MPRTSENKPEEWFSGIEIWDSTGRYYVSVANINNDMQHNRPTSSNLTYNNKYPFHIHDGMPNYFSGSCTATFMENCTSATFDEIQKIIEEGKQEGVQYCCPEDVMDAIEGEAATFEFSFIEWLHNDHVKYLRIVRDWVFPVGILETIDVNIDDSYTADDPWNLTITFNWEQLADKIPWKSYGTGDILVPKD